MARTSVPPHDVADLSLAPDGAAQIAWASEQMPVLARVAERFMAERPLDGVAIAACLHVTAETANLVRTLLAGGASVALCSANPLSTQDAVAAALVIDHGVEVRAHHGEDLDTYASHVRALLDGGPQVTIDDGADLMVTAHAAGEGHEQRQDAREKRGDAGSAAGGRLRHARDSRASSALPALS